LSEKRGFDYNESGTEISKCLKPRSPRHICNLGLCLSLRYLGRLFGQLVSLLVPSFLHRRSQSEPGKNEKLAPTAFLDGMRGLAAFAVFICHLTYGTFDIVHAWGAAPDPETKPPTAYREFIRLPVVRLLYSGPPMVAIFFVISGYALSYKPLKQMRSRQHDQLMTTMTSSIFRRGLRLFLPCFASTFIVISLAQLNLYKLTEDFSNQMRMVLESHCYTQPNMWLQFTDWLVQMLIFVDVFNWSLFAGSIELDRHLWTIPVEFRCSMALFLTHMLTARMPSRLRIMTFAGLIIWGVSWDRWELTPFWAGAVIAELDIIWTSKTASELPSTSADSQPQPPQRSCRILCWSAFLLSLFLLSFPDVAANVTPGFVTLDSLIPQSFTEKHRFWPIVGAVLIVWSSCRLGVLRNRAFCWTPVQYLGKISFPLYVMHGPVIHTLGYLVKLPSFTSFVLLVLIEDRYSLARPNWKHPKP
jgi:peptidoglycan/LPS O-acetylase OafA/YrhL